MHLVCTILIHRRASAGVHGEEVPAVPSFSIGGACQTRLVVYANVPACKAMKDQQFRDHMDEYVREISDPKHRKEYLDYLDQVLSVLPGAGSSTSTKKLFVARNGRLGPF